MYERPAAFQANAFTCPYAVGRYFPYAYGSPVGGNDPDDVAFLEIAVYCRHSYREQARCFFSGQSRQGSGIDMDIPFGEAVGMRYPFFDM